VREVIRLAAILRRARASACRWPRRRWR